MDLVIGPTQQKLNYCWLLLVVRGLILTVFKFFKCSLKNRLKHQTDEEEGDLMHLIVLEAVKTVLPSLTLRQKICIFHLIANFSVLNLFALSIKIWLIIVVVGIICLYVEMELDLGSRFEDFTFKNSNIFANWFIQCIVGFIIRIFRLCFDEQYEVEVWKSSWNGEKKIIINIHN